MIRDYAKLASIIALSYCLFSSISIFQLYPYYSSPSLWPLLPRILLPTAASGVIAWGLWHRHQWAWRLGLAASLIQLGLSITSTYLYYTAINAAAGRNIAPLPNTSYFLALSYIGSTFLAVLVAVLLHPKTRIIFRQASENRVALSKVPVSALGLMNISIALAFAISALASVGGKILNLLVPSFLVQNIAPYKAHLLNSAANYWLPALLIYLGFRLTRARSWLNPNPAIHAILGLANLLFILYITARIFASAVPGGGASFVVMQFAPLIVYPARLLLFGGIVWLAIRFTNLAHETWRTPFSKIEIFAVFTAFVIPAAFISTFYIGENAPIRLAHEARELFQVKCAAASEHLPKHPVEEVQGIYIEGDFEARYGIKDGAYSGSSVGIWGEPMVNSGWLLFMEVPDSRNNPEAKYRRHYLKDWKGMPTDSLLSRYGVFTTALTSEIERKLGVMGTEIKVVDLETKETIATSSYFVNTREGKFCGVAPNGYFSTSDFVRRALGLKMQYPSAFAKPVDTGKPKQAEK